MILNTSMMTNGSEFSPLATGRFYRSLHSFTPNQTRDDFTNTMSVGHVFSHFLQSRLMRHLTADLLLSTLGRMPRLRMGLPYLSGNFLPCLQTWS